MPFVSDVEKRALQACSEGQSVLNAKHCTVHCQGVAPQVLWALWRDGLIAEQHVARNRWTMVLTPRGRNALDRIN